ncbi:MAG TPA: hypothetical protein EYN41_07985 [Flavobacteriales bacterium]|nr:hypothetical protein [Flavobacteriales bacterium]
MVDQLDIYFKKARESLSEPVPIAEIKSKLNASPGVNPRQSIFSRGLQVLAALAVVFAGLYFWLDSQSTVEEGVVDNETIQQDEILMEQPQEASVEDISAEVLQSKQEIDLTVQSDKASPIGENGQPPEPTKQAEENLKPASEPPTQTAEDGQSDAHPVIDPEPEPQPEPEAAKPTSGTMPAIRDQAEANGGHRFEILSTSTRKDLKELDKTLSKYGINMNVKVLEYDREWISRLNGYFEDLTTGSKSKFNINSLNFEKLVFTFKYSESTGPLDMRSAGE